MIFLFFGLGPGAVFLAIWCVLEPKSLIYMLFVAFWAKLFDLLLAFGFWLWLWLLAFGFGFWLWLWAGF